MNPSLELLFSSKTGKGTHLVDMKTAMEVTVVDGLANVAESDLLRFTEEACGFHDDVTLYSVFVMFLSSAFSWSINSRQ